VAGVERDILNTRRPRPSPCRSGKEFAIRVHFILRAAKPKIYSPLPATPIDYRCDDGKKKLVCWGDILVSLRSWIQKMLAINPLQALVRSQTQKKKNILHGLSIPNSNFSGFAYFGK
jgi:hypothetical protein